MINSCDREWREREARVTYGRLLAHRSERVARGLVHPYTFRTIAMLLTTSCPHGKPAIYPVTPKSSRPPTLRPPACRRGTRPSLSLYAPTADNKQQRQHSAAIGHLGLWSGQSSCRPATRRVRAENPAGQRRGCARRSPSSWCSWRFTRVPTARQDSSGGAASTSTSPGQPRPHWPAFHVRAW